MKRRRISARLLWLALAAALVMSLTPAALAAEPTSRVSGNINDQNYGTWSKPVRSYLCENTLGGLTRVEYTETEVLVEDYDQDFVLQGSRTLPTELTDWGGFFAGAEYNYLIFGQSNYGEDDEKEVIRIVQYSKDWVRLGQASLRGANTVHPFEAGSLRCDEYGGWLYVRTCHKMYTAKDGLNHQANLMIALRQSDMTITDSFYLVESGVGYVSHSFNQFILVDGQGRIVALDHGDAYPRSALFQRYVVKAGQDSFRLSEEDKWIWTDMGDGHRVGKPAPVSEEATLVAFPGAIGANATGCSIGGLAETAQGYVAAYRYDGLGGGGARDIYLAAIGEDLSVETVRLTEGADALTPQLAAVSPEKGYVLWNELVSRTSEYGYTYSDMDDTLHYAAYGPDGTVGQIQTAAGVSLSDCAPVSWNGKAVWYVTDDSTPIFYLLDENGVEAKLTDSTEKFSDVEPGGYYAAPVTWAVNRGITTGTGEDTFTPERVCTHGEILTMIWRALGRPQAETAAPVEASWFPEAVNWAYEYGIIGDSFQVNADCTRADAAVYLWLAFGAPQAEGTSAFTDVPADAPYAEAVAWALEQEITTGVSADSFAPQNTCTRAQIVTFLYRCFSK